MYNWAFRTFCSNLLAKAKDGYFKDKPKELAEYQASFRRGVLKFGMHPLDKHAVIDGLREYGIRATGEGKWSVI